MDKVLTGLNKVNVAESALADLKKLEKVIAPLCTIWDDCDSMVKLEAEIKEMRDDPSVDTETLLKMSCRLGNCYNLIMKYKKDLDLNNPFRRATGYIERSAAKIEIWNWIYKAFHLEKLPNFHAKNTMKLLLAEEYR